MDGERSNTDTNSGSRVTTRRNEEKEKPFELAFLAPKETDKKNTKRKYKKKEGKKEASEGLQENFSMLLNGVFSIAAKSSPVWIVQQEEVDLVVAPACRIFERYVSEKAEETSDAIALVIALALLLVPRIVVTMSANKGERRTNEQKREVPPSNIVAAPKFADAISGSGDYVC